ncbi:MAG: nucleoside triphosphate pyrophosphohydrolase [Deltaproteobacteria bacterium]|nr:nucleoside triphosphate pyrophosphohydrolase [Deltaproteobacteria bacterium]
MADDLKDRQGLRKLQAIIQALRAPDGCPWDRKQTKADIGKYLLEEAYEVIDALDEASPDHQKEELGDLLFQILFICRLGEEAGEFTLQDVMDDIAAKMIRRHPHVFGDIKVGSIEEVKANWEDIKRNIEKKEPLSPGLLGKTPRSLPALMKAQKITEKASLCGFDWEDIEGVFDKVNEELLELRSALKGGLHNKIAEETGDVLFSLVNLSRFAGVNAEEALNASAGKFTRRFSRMESALDRQGRNMAETSPEELDRLWNEAKINEKKEEP